MYWGEPGSSLYVMTSFRGTGPDPYQLLSESRSRDNGLTRTATHADITGGSGGQFLYVDADADTSYDPTWDVIVDLQGASVTGSSAKHSVCTTDLLGNKRVKGIGIERGAYECVASGTVITIR